MPDKKVPANIDAYIREFPEEQRQRMERLRTIIHEEAPEASEKISWAMPTFYLHGNLVHFARGKHHTGLYPGADGVAHFIPQLEALGLKYSKGAIQMPDAQPLPEGLIREILRFRVKQQEGEG